MTRFHLSDRVRRTLSHGLALAVALAIGTVATTLPAAAQSDGTIEGLVYADLDGDGQAGPDDPGLPGVIVRLTDENNTSKSVLTSLNGSYEFDGLEPGDYDIKVETGRDFNPTTLASYDGIAVGNDSLTGLDFGLEAETAAAEAIVEQAILDAEANADATAEASEDEAADDEESIDDEADDEADEDASDEEMDEEVDTEADEAASDDEVEAADEASDEATDTDSDAVEDVQEEDMSGDEDEDAAADDDDMDDDSSELGDYSDEAGAGGVDDGSAYGGDQAPVDVMPGAGFEDMGIPGLLAALALGMAALAAAGVWRERRGDLTR